jgi:DNA (cytosine-5)-methyltransferase 1
MIAYVCNSGTKNFKNNDCKINLDIARPLTTDPNKRDGTTNYLSEDLPDNYGLQFLKIPEATKKGYAEAEEGDGVYINRPHIKRGCVQKGMIQTIKTSVNDIGVVIRVGNYSPSKHNASTVVSGEGIAPTVMENHGTVTAVVEDKPKLVGGSYNYQLNDLRIRKLTPKECFKLMGVKVSDYEKIEVSNTQKYKQAGNSIVTTVLMAIYSGFFEDCDCDYKACIEKLVNDLKEGV